ncbi:hypothetical protein EDD16DRAFT_1660306 [Pisolithus croceorrhizus]|nr:hypothetical protein EDD16DRAFT_1660306 [Pisolithus croceorrhizus]
MGRFRILSTLVFSVPRSAISDGWASPTLTVVWHFWTTRECLSIPYQPLLPEEVCCTIDCALPARCASCAISHSNSRVLRH